MRVNKMIAQTQDMQQAQQARVRMQSSRECARSGAAGAFELRFRDGTQAVLFGL